MTDTTTHDTITPGPWTAEEYRPGWWQILGHPPATDGILNLIATMESRDSAANARAIAALPALLEAAREMVESGYLENAAAGSPNVSRLLDALADALAQIDGDAETTKEKGTA